MARTAGQMPRGPFSFDFAARVQAAVPALCASRPLGERPVRGDVLTARAIAYSGLVALFGLPILMLASLALAAPFATPAAIALGYLAASYALASRHPRSAAAINAVVLSGLVVWSLSLPLGGEEFSRAGLAAALLAPFFAAAPALARFAITPRTDAASGIALRNAACLDQLAPDEAVLVVRRDGTLLAATRAATAALQLPAGAVGSDVGRCFGLVDRPKLSDAIARCPSGETTEVTLQGENRGEGEAPAYTAEILAAGAGAVSIRLRSAAVGARPLTVAEPSRCGDPDPTSDLGTGPICDVGEAVAFAMRHAEANAGTRRAALTWDVGDGIWARCDRQICRRIVVLMLEGALPQSGPGDHLHLTARTLKGVVLLRLAVRPGPGSPHFLESAEGNISLAVLHQMVEAAGGTLVADRNPAEIRLSVRLDLAATTDGTNARR